MININIKHSNRIGQIIENKIQNKKKGNKSITQK